MHERMRESVKLTPEQRRKAARKLARVKKIDKDQRSAKWEQYQQLPRRTEAETRDRSRPQAQAAGAAKAVRRAPRSAH